MRYLLLFLFSFVTTKFCLHANLVQTLISATAIVFSDFLFLSLPKFKKINN